MIHAMDDVLSAAETCAKLLVNNEKVRAYRRLARKVTTASESWDMTPAGRRMVLRAYKRAYREALGLDRHGEIPWPKREPGDDPREGSECP